MKVFAENRKARFDYEILETIEAGLELRGFEVKSVKAGKANVTGAHVIFRGGEAFIVNTEIPPYQALNTPDDYDPTRTRKILLNRKEIERLMDKKQTERLTIVPLRLYNKAGLIKIELALGRGKKKTDKRQQIKKRETDREIRRTLKRSQ